MAQYVIRKMLGINKFGLTISLLTLILALFIFPIFISMFYINEYARVEITHLLKSESCEATYTHRNANPLNPLEFYLNHRYWLSDYRLPDVYLENKDYSNCLNRVLNKMIALKNFIVVVWVSRENRYVDRAGLLRSYVSYLAAGIVSGFIGFGLLWLVGIHTDISSTLGRMAVAGIKLFFVSAVTGLAYLLSLRFAAPRESATMMRPLLTRLRVPGAVVNILAASCAPSPRPAAIMTGHTPDETEEPMAPAPERTGDDDKLPSFDEVLSDSPIPAPPVDTAAQSEETTEIPTIPAPDSEAADTVDTVEATEASGGAQEQAIPKSLSEYNIEPIVEGTDAAQVDTQAFPLAPPPPAPGSSGYERSDEINPEDYPHPTPLEDGPSTHQVPRVAAASIPAPPVEEETEVMEAIPAISEEPAKNAAVSENDEQGTSAHSGKLIDPTKPALIFGILVVLFGAIWGPWMATRPVTDLDLGQSLRAGINQQQSNEEPTPPMTTEPSEAATAAPAISSVQVLSWNNDDGDHPDRAINMIEQRDRKSVV